MELGTGPFTVGDLSTRAMLVALNISVWTARRYDRRATAEVANNHGAKGDAGRYHKRLIDKADSYAAILKVTGEAREYYYRYTLPWAQDGARILPSAAYMDFAEAMRRFGGQMDQAVATFVKDYPELVRASQVGLGTLWNADDYPPADDIGKRFAFGIKVLPLPCAGDFRVALSDETTQAIRDQITEQVQAATADAMRDVWDRAYTAVSNMVARLSDPDAVFRDTLVGNIRDLCDVLPVLNLTQDPKLEQCRQDMLTALAGQDPDTLRHDKAVRRSTADKAAAILRTMDGYISAGV